MAPAFVATYTPGVLCSLQFGNTIEALEKLVSHVFQKNRFTPVSGSALVAPTSVRVQTVEQLDDLVEELA